MLQLLGRAEIVEPDMELAVCRDPADDKFFACALSGEARYIVTEDKDILDVGDYRGIKPISSEEFIALVERD